MRSGTGSRAPSRPPRRIRPPGEGPPLGSAARGLPARQSAVPLTSREGPGRLPDPSDRRSASSPVAVPRRPVLPAGTPSTVRFGQALSCRWPSASRHGHPRRRRAATRHRRSLVESTGRACGMQRGTQVVTAFAYGGRAWTAATGPGPGPRPCATCQPSRRGCWPCRRSGPRPGLQSRRSTPNAQHRTLNAQRRTPNAQRPTPNAQRPTPNAQRPTPNAQRPTPNAQRSRGSTKGASLPARRYNGMSSGGRLLLRDSEDPESLYP
jgi:hypothetical protein